MVYFLVLCLVFTATGIAPLSALPALFLPFALPRLILLRVPRYVSWLIAYFIVSLISIIFYSPSALGDFDFYRRDGNFFISFAPIIVFTTLSCRIDPMKFFIRLLYFFVILIVLILLINVIQAGPSSLLARGEGRNLDFLFDSNNAAGGWTAIISCLGFAAFIQKKTFVRFSAFAICAVFLYLLNSRGSLIGLIVALAIQIIGHGSPKRKIWLLGMAFLIACIATGFALQSGYPVYVENYAGQPPLGLLDTYDSGKEANIFIRLYENWPRGFYAFMHSPILGTGFGSVNDLPFNFVGWEGIFQWNRPQTFFYNSSHAHNSYLHIMGEQGLVGMALFMGFWVSLSRDLINGKDGMIENFLFMAVITLLFSGFTEHRLTTPSMVLPFTLSLALWQCARNFQVANAKKHV